jgi:hypothetical protein
VRPDRGAAIPDPQQHPEPDWFAIAVALRQRDAERQRKRDAARLRAALSHAQRAADADRVGTPAADPDGLGAPGVSVWDTVAQRYGTSRSCDDARCPIDHTDPEPLRFHTTEAAGVYPIDNWYDHTGLDPLHQWDRADPAAWHFPPSRIARAFRDAWWRAADWASARAHRRR